MTKKLNNDASIFIYCTEAEKAIIKKASFKAEKNMSVYCRDALVEHSRKLIEANK